MTESQMIEYLHCTHDFITHVAMFNNLTENILFYKLICFSKFNTLYFNNFGIKKTYTF